jgi:hypothetical protein
MSSFAFSGRAACVALLSGLCLIAAAPVEARDNSKGVPHHANEFYAVAPTHAEPEDAPATRGQCFTTNSPMEATKGIRHWSGRC